MLADVRAAILLLACFERHDTNGVHTATASTMHLSASSPTGLKETTFVGSAVMSYLLYSDSI